MISIITIVLNQRNLIEETILSVISQRSVEIQYVIVDGGSTDGTLDIISKYNDHIDICISERDGGIYDAINKGISYVKHPLVGIIHCGDIFNKDVLCGVYEQFVLLSPDVIYGDIVIEYNDSTKRSFKADHKKLSDRMSIYHPSTFVAAKVYNQDLYDLSYKSASDYDFFLRLYFQNKVFQYYSHEISTFRSGGLSGANYYLSLKENYSIRKRHIGRISAVRFLIISLVTHYSVKVVRNTALSIIDAKNYKKIKRLFQKNWIA